MGHRSKHIKLSLKDQKLFDHAIQIINDHIGEESFGIEELRKGLSLSRSQLHRRLHKITGLSTSLFIRSVRLNKAFELLKEGKHSVSEIAYLTGFSSPSYFSKCFHEQYGFAPGEIHKQKITEIDQNDIFKSRDFAGPIQDRKDGPGRKSLFVYGTIIMAIAIFAIIYFSYFKPSGETQIHEKSIAVLPFKNFSDKPENQYLSDGMMEAILMNISKIGDLKVISRTSVEQYRKSQKSVKQIGEELGVKHILEGSTYLDEQDIRITVQLIDSKTDQHIWSESYDTKLDNIFTIQSQIAKIIANVLHAQISAEEMKRIERIPTLNQKAYDLYQKALYYYINFLLGRQEQDYQKSRSLLSLSIKEDSTFAAGYTKLADLYWMRNYRTEYHSETFMDTVFSLSQKALSYDPQSSDAHRLLGQYYFETGRSEQGITELETSISFNSNNAGSYATLGFYKNWTGDWETGIPHILESIQLDPFSISLPMRYAYLARAYLDILDFESTFFYTRRVIEQGEGRNPALSFAYWINAHSNLVLGNSVEALKAAENINEISSMRMQAEIYCHLLRDFDKGVELYRELFQRDPGYFNYRHRYAYALWETGEKDSAKLMFDTQILEFEKELELGRVGRNDPHYNLAGIYAFLEEYDKAFEHLKKHKWTSGLEIYAEKDPMFKNLYNNEEFKMIIQKAIDDKELLRKNIAEQVSEDL